MIDMDHAKFYVRNYDQVRPMGNLFSPIVWCRSTIKKQRAGNSDRTSVQNERIYRYMTGTTDRNNGRRFLDEKERTPLTEDERLKSFGENLKELLKQRNLTVRALSKTLNIPQASLNEWVGTHSRLPRDADVIKRLAEFFDVSIHELLFGTPEPKTFLGEILEKTEVHTGLYEITIKKVLPKKISKDN